MYPQSHFLLPFVLGLGFVKLEVLDIKLALIAGLLGVLIDIDHYIAFLYYYKDFNIKHVWNAAVVKGDPIERTFIHHKIGFVVMTKIIEVLLLFNPLYSLVLALGYYTHLLLDYIHLIIPLQTFKHPKKIVFVEDGFTVKLPVYEILFDSMLIFLIVMYYLS